MASPRGFEPPTSGLGNRYTRGFATVGLAEGDNVRLVAERGTQVIQIQTYGLVLGSVLRTSFTTDSDTRRVRAIAAGFMPAW